MTLFIHSCHIRDNYDNVLMFFYPMLQAMQPMLVSFNHWH